MMVNALKQLTDLPTEIITFSDDMDGLRKVPDNVPNKELLEKAEEISNGLKRLSKKSRKVVMPYHSSYDLIEELEEVADSLVQDLKE